ncbi:EF-hand calcium-binding domain-containing protein 6 isoform X1 [Micropterus dolomieu]|uniref:EF-hand calcium-binding domain-containing protein 6 isoform X1 n=1 Tax=Micropterus dolomieu TaxID=147949 RepID=UPI001E8CBEB1|nr:EF-hand calcium-binding domain-containing protein 6 isoform X1 [Micropterus dolomieu]
MCICSYGVRATGPVRWKHFVGHFMSLVKQDGDTNLHTNRAFEQPAQDEDNMDFQDIYHRLKEIFHLLDTKEEGFITRADLRHLLERPGGTWPRKTKPRLQRSQIPELLNALDPKHTGVIQLASLERLNPSITSAPTGNTAPPHSPTNTAGPLEVLEETEDTAEEQKTPDERQTTQCADKVYVTSASWRTVENVSLGKLCDPQHITQEDLRKAISCNGMSVSDTHFNKPSTSPQTTLQSVSGQQSPLGLQVAPETCTILDNVFQRMRSRLEQRHSSLTDCIQAVTHSSDGTLSETDVWKILEDSWVILDDTNFNKFTELLGCRDGRIECSLFLAKYEEATVRDREQGSEGHGEKAEVDPLLSCAEQCLAAMKTRIKIIHGDNLTAFCLMDRKHKGVVNCHDFKRLYNSLRFFCRDGEYQRLLDLIGLHPGGNLNYAEFVDVVENHGKRKQGTQRASLQEQLHELLACEARYKWADMSKVLCQFDTDSQGWIHKNSLREFLFTYALPMRSDEFDQLWLRYDPEQRGSVAVCDFLEKLGIYHEGELRSLSQKLKRTVAQPDRHVSSDAASLECIEQTLQENYEGLSDCLAHLETRSDGTVTVEELLGLLQTYSCSVQREQLVNHLRRLNVSMGDNGKRLSYMDFLSAFDHKAEKCEPPPVSPDAVCQIESLSGLSPSVAVAKMQELVTVSAPHLYKAFLAFDLSGKGMVKALEFRQVLENFCAHLSDKQYKYMLTKLELDCENCTVNWKDFLRKFQSQSPVISAERSVSWTWEKGTNTRSPIQTKTSEITEHLQQIQEVVSGHSYEITKELMNLDPSNSTTISKEQFRKLCDHHCLTLTNDQFECVWSQMPVNEQKKLQCRKFLWHFGALGRTPHTKVGGTTNNVPSPSPEPGETVSATISCCPETAGAILQRTKSAPQCTSRHPASVGRPGTGSPLGSIERRLRGVVQRCWKEIQRSCTKEDPQQQGHISTTSFLEILQSLSINITREQFEHLAANFDITNNDCVIYHNFLHHFVLNLKPAEAWRPFGRHKLPLPTTTTSQGVLSKDCVEVMLRIYDVVRSTWTSVRRCFLMFDRTRTGIVSVQDFRKVLRHFSLNLSEEEFFHLCSYFDANSTGKIYYNNFLRPFLH